MRYILLFLVFCSQAALAGIPAALNPIVISPPFSFSERVFDLDPAFRKSRETKKPLLLYLGAKDCPPCLNYERLLEANISKVAPTFENFILADIQTWLRGPEIIFTMNQKRYTVAQFKIVVGDTYPKLRYPAVWMLSENGLLLKQIPSKDMTELATVDGTIRLLALP